jgi:hypothetical protein
MSQTYSTKNYIIHRTPKDSLGKRKNTCFFYFFIIIIFLEVYDNSLSIWTQIHQIHYHQYSHTTQNINNLRFIIENKTFQKKNGRLHILVVATRNSNPLPPPLETKSRLFTIIFQIKKILKRDLLQP